MLSTPEVLKKCAERCCLERVRFEQKKMPSSPSAVTVFPFFGDIRSTVILSSLLLNRIREEAKGSRYFVVVSWPGFESLFPYADEYWTVPQNEAVKLFGTTEGFENNSSLAMNYHKNLNYFFDVFDEQELLPFYNDGFTSLFFEKFRHIKRFAPAIPSAGILGGEFVRKLNKLAGQKVFLFPALYHYGWKQGKPFKNKTPKQFWVLLVKELVQAGLSPIIYQNFATHDVSVELTEHLFILEKDISKVMGAMRNIGCVLDVFGQISRLAIAARTPYILVDERLRYNFLQENEIDSLCADLLPHDHIFSFSTLLDNEDVAAWRVNLFNIISSRLNNFFADFDRSNLPSTAELEEIVPYDRVKKQRMKKLGTKFIKVNSKY